MRIPMKPGGSFSHANGPVTHQLPGALYSDSHCNVLVGRVNKSELMGGDLVADCSIDESALPHDLDASALEYSFVVDESLEPGVGASYRQRSFFLSRRS
jgi:hypothetical protein